MTSPGTVHPSSFDLILCHPSIHKREGVSCRRQGRRDAAVFSWRLATEQRTVRLEWMKGLGNPPNIWVPRYCKLAICKLFCDEIEFVSLCLRKIWAPWYTIFGNPEIQNSDLLVWNVAYYESNVWFHILWLHLLAELPNCLNYGNPDLKNLYV